MRLRWKKDNHEKEYIVISLDIRLDYSEVHCDLFPHSWNDNEVMQQLWESPMFRDKLEKLIYADGEQSVDVWFKEWFRN